MIVRVGTKSDIGRVRERNEDSFLARAPLYAVADGMGGHRGGNVASAMALETLQEVAENGHLSELIEKVKQANVRVLERGEAERDLRGMGTTLTALVADGSTAYLVHIGDSRAYLLREGTFQQLTRDHTLVQRMVDEGRLTREEAERHPQRSILTRALGVDADAEPDPLTLDLHPGDRILLCTDGLTAMIDVDSIRQILEEESDPQAACDRLIDAANAAGGEDNITVVVLDFEEGEEGPDAGTTATRAANTVAPAPEGASGLSAKAGAQARTRPGRGSGTATATAPVAHGEDGPSDLTVVGRPLELASETLEPDGAAVKPAVRHRRRRRVLIWAAAVLVVLGVVAAGVRFYVDRQWYVGDAGGRVAIYKGIPTRVLTVDLSHVQETTELSSTAAEQLAPWRRLHDGITADSLAAARSIVDQIRRDVQNIKVATG
jgi:PPM family protein phosphatase